MTIERLHRNKANHGVHFWSALASDPAIAQAGFKEDNNSSYNWSTKPEMKIVMFGSTSTDSGSK